MILDRRNYASWRRSKRFRIMNDRAFAAYMRQRGDQKGWVD
jgi:hypothetical protein